MRKRRTTLVLAPLLGLVLLAACSSSSSGSGATSSATPSAKGSLVVGTAGFTESEVLGNMYAQLLNKLGYHTSITNVASSEIFQSSLQKGAINVVPEYAATYANQLDAIVHNKSAGDVASSNLDQTYTALQQLANKLGLTALTPSSAVDQNAFAVSKSFAAAHHLSTLSDLGASGLSVTIAGPAECATRPFCKPGLEKTYGIKVKGIDPLGFDTIQGKKAVQSGTDEVAEVATTDATVSDFDLVVLTDDKHLQNADNVVPIVHTKSLTPEIKAELDKLSAMLTTEDLAQLNKQVDIERMTPADVAKAYLTSKGLI
jgi:osmoprotectant transport system substrate-binding protein